MFIFYYFGKQNLFYWFSRFWIIFLFLFKFSDNKMDFDWSKFVQTNRFSFSVLNYFSFQFIFFLFEIHFFRLILSLLFLQIWFCYGQALNLIMDFLFKCFLCSEFKTNKQHFFWNEQADTEIHLVTWYLYFLHTRLQIEGCKQQQQHLHQQQQNSISKS